MLRGPQGTLYGATAEGGLIKYVTNPPNLRTYSGSVEGGFDGIAAGNTGGGLGGTVRAFANIPIIPDKVAIRLSGVNEFLPGYIQNFTNGKSNINAGEQQSWRAQLLAKPDDRWTVRLFASRQTIFSNDSNSLQVQGAAANPAQTEGQLTLINPLQRDARFPSNSQLESSLNYGQVTFEPGYAPGTSTTSYGYNTLFFNNYTTDINLVPGVTFGAGLVAPFFGQAGNVRLPQQENTQKFNEELRVSSNPGSQLGGYGFDWQFGGYYTRETNQLRQALNFFSATAPFAPLLGPPSPGADILKSNYQEAAGFGQFTFHLTPAISIDVGGRVAANVQHSQFTAFGDIAFGPTALSPQVNTNDRVGIYNVAPKWQIDNDTLLYARVASGYRPGGPNLIVPSLANVPGIQRSYSSDGTVNYEVGVRRDLFNKKVQADVTAFRVDWSSVQILSIFNTTAGPVGLIGNAGNAVSQGVEWNLAWSVLPGLKVGINGAYTDARLTVDAPGLGARNGDFLPFVPRVTTNANVDYFWEPFNNVQAFVSGTATYLGTRFTNFSTAVANNNHSQLPGYVIGSIRGGLEFGHYSVEAFINNISDTRGITTYLNNGGANQTGLVTVTQPRLVGGLLRVKF